MGYRGFFAAVVPVNVKMCNNIMCNIYEALYCCRFSAALEEIMLCCILNADISYVTFSKASEAALAIEEMNGKCLFDNPRPLKVIHSIIS